MRAVVQRATSAHVVVDREVVGQLPSPGLVVLLGITHTDTAAQADKLARKVWDLRIIEGEGGSDSQAWSKGDVSASDIGAPLLVISQFTLYADTRKGRRPSWSEAAPADVAQSLYEYFVSALRSLGAHVECGVFGAMMDVSLTNHGPVTLVLEV
ncbi:MAG: D-tyrosyl-tRNA(Tyr) deacylase [Propionibacteriaceae bacterium]|jgi:D-tyrosyl-tRNA(Tyr) deacylase|nr:D-tyrosyl-tRNA(Tyr) deacylase [Propionibacteriaceae bacterium]